MDIVSFGKAVSNELRVSILMLLAGPGMELKECFEKVKVSFPNIHRESVYRALEELVEIKLVRKEYSQEDKRLLYSLTWRYVKIDFSTGMIELSN